jgi:hypothetical protein
LGRVRVPKFGRSAVFLIRDVLGGYPPAVWVEEALSWRISAASWRIEAGLRLLQSALADIYLALPPR